MDDKPKTLREAIEKILWCCQWMYDNTGDQSTKDHLKKPIEIAEAALAIPQRNCDVGTPEEQYRRFRSFCESHDSGGDFDNPCHCCELKQPFGCETAFGNLPYKGEEGEA